MIAPPAGYLLLLLMLLPLVGLWQHLGWRQRAVALNVSHRAHTLAWTWRRATIWVPPALHLVALALLILALSRPFDWHAAQMTQSEGIAIELVIDHSGSMRRDDAVLDGRRVSRLDAVVDAAGRFVVGSEETGSRSQDLIGLISFAGTADVVSPLTFDHERVVASLEHLEAVADYRRDGTAIGDGLALGVAELQSLAASLRMQGTDGELTRIVVLLTDGQQNAGELPPREAARLAKHYGIRTYVIELGGRDYAAAQAASHGEVVGADAESLREIARMTGGAYFRVGEARSLRSIYASIADLERTQLTDRRLAARREWAVEWFRWGPWRMPPIALIALFCIALETVLRRTIYLTAV